MNERGDATAGDEKAREFTGRTALIMGGARGIGFAAARLLSAQGARLALADIDGDAACAAAAALGGSPEPSGCPIEAIGLRADIVRDDEVAQTMAEAARELGLIDIFVSSAAVLGDKTFLQSSPADWDRMLSICLRGPMLCLHALLPGMVFLLAHLRPHPGLALLFLASRRASWITVRC